MTVKIVTDSEIIDLFNQRDEMALQKTQDKYGAYCKTIAINILVSKEDTDECINDVLLKVWNAIPPEVPKSLQAYLGKITRNSALNTYECKNAAKRGGTQVDIAFSELEEVLSEQSNVEQAFNKQIFADFINEFLSKLPKQQRIIFLKRYLYFINVNEIAQELDISESKVKSVLFRLRNKLKTELEKEGF